MGEGEGRLNLVTRLRLFGLKMVRNNRDFMTWWTHKKHTDTHSAHTVARWTPGRLHISHITNRIAEPLNSVSDRLKSGSL